MSRARVCLALAVVAACASARTSPGVAQAPEPEPSLSPGDVLKITVWRALEFSGEFPVSPDGTLAHPLYQGVRVVGLPISGVKARLREFLRAYEQDPHLVVEPLFPVAVAGDVRTPGLYTLARGTTIAQAIARAGGPTERGRLDRVRLVRRGRESTLDLVSQESAYGASAIVSGDQLFIGRRSDFNVVRDVLGPLASLTAAVAAVIAVNRR
jgi:protein involved in polysaccharide export with SLBB domain